MPYDLKQYLEARYLQSEDVRLKTVPENCRPGVCFGLTLLWAERHKAQKNEGPAARIKAITSDFQKVVAAQQSYEAATGKEGKEKETPLWAGAGFTIGEYTGENVVTGDDYAKTAAAALVSMLVTAGRKHQYSALSFKNQKGAHQMICYHSGGKIFGIASHLYFFDPNGGEFRIPNDSMQEFFTEYWFKARRTAKLADINKILWAPLTPN